MVANVTSIKLTSVGDENLLDGSVFVLLEGGGGGVSPAGFHSEDLEGAGGEGPPRGAE